MGGPVQRRKLRVSAFYVLAFLALLFKVCVPTGFMVGNGGTILICTGISPMKMAIPLPEVPTAPDKHKADHPCPYAGNAAPPLAPPMGTALLAPVALAPGLASVSPRMRLGRGLAAPPPPSTGPPLRRT